MRTETKVAIEEGSAGAHESVRGPKPRNISVQMELGVCPGTMEGRGPGAREQGPKEKNETKPKSKPNARINANDGAEKRREWGQHDRNRRDKGVGHGKEEENQKGEVRQRATSVELQRQETTRKQKTSTQWHPN